MTADLSNRDLIFCPAACRKSGRESVMRLASVGFLSRLRAVSYTCGECEHVTAVSLRKGSFTLPREGGCWNCSVASDPVAGSCPSCGVDPSHHSQRMDGILATFAPSELGELGDRGSEELIVHLERARAERRLGDALRAVDALTYRLPLAADSWRRKTELYLENGFLTLALQTVKRALHHEPSDLDTLLSFANILALLDELEAAVEVVSGAAGRAPTDPRPPSMLAGYLEKLERYDEARAAAKLSLALDPDRADAWSTLATLHMRQKEYAEAATAWGRVTGLAPDASLAHRYQGLCHLSLGQWPEAAAAGRRAGDDDPEAVELVFEALLNQGDGDAAYAQAERAVARYPGETRFLYLKARAHMSRGALLDGVAVCDQILALEPDAGWARKARAAFTAKLGPDAVP